MYSKLIFGCGLLSMAAFCGSCSSDEQESLCELQQQQNGVVVTAPAFTMDEGQTRVFVDVSGAPVRFSWEKKDAMGIFLTTDVDQQVKYSLSKGEGTSTATFENDADFTLATGSQYVAYFPYNTTDEFTAQNVPATYAGQRIASNGSTAHLGKYAYMAAVPTTTTQALGTQFELAHLGCLVRFTLTMPRADVYEELQITGLGEKLIGKGCVNLLESIHFVSADSVRTFRVGLGDFATTAAGDKLVIYVMMAPGNYENQQWYLFTKGQKNVYMQTIDARNMQAGNAYAFDVTMTEPHAIDIGMTVNGKRIYWADINIGASSPSECGDYFAWGETEGFFSGCDEFSWDNYLWAADKVADPSKYDYTSYGDRYNTPHRHYILKYNSVDGKTELDPEDDAAVVNWGNGWRMPTKDELFSLSIKSYGETTLDGTDGRQFGSGENSIFLPNTGVYGQVRPVNAAYGRYRASTLMDSNVNESFHFDFGSYMTINQSPRQRGETIRAVRETPIE